MPSSLHLNGKFFSSYKNHTTLKGLIGISPGGATTFVSQLYTGSIYHWEITVRIDFSSCLLKRMTLLWPTNVLQTGRTTTWSVIKHHPFLGSSPQMPEEDVEKTPKIASLRKHVKRAINKVKSFHIWDGIVPLHQFGVVNQMWAICAFLCNVQANVISA